MRKKRGDLTLDGEANEITGADLEELGCGFQSCAELGGDPECEHHRTGWFPVAVAGCWADFVLRYHGWFLLVPLICKTFYPIWQWAF
jgi:hypothetical protein